MPNPTTFLFSDDSSITLDVTLQERHNGKVVLTRFPIEEGMKPSDAAQLEPRTFGVDGIFTNLPLDETTQQERAGGQFVSEMIDLLWSTLNAREALSIDSTRRGRLENMVMTSLSMPDTADIGEAVQFSAEFTEVRFVSTQTVKLAPKQTSVPQKPTSKDKQGTKVAQPASKELEQSVAKWGADKTGFTTQGSGVPNL